MLSQEEIEALLKDGDGQKNDTAEIGLTDVEKDAVGEISNICMGSAATTLSTLVNEKVVITTPVVSLVTLNELSSNFGRPCVFVQIAYIEGLDGSNVLILDERDVKVITDLMMGGDGSNVADELSDLHLSAISEAMNQMMGASSTSLSSMLERKVDISPPKASLLDLSDSIQDEMTSFLDGEFVMVSFKMEIGDIVDSQIMQLYSIDFAKDLYRKFVGEQAEATAPEEPVAAPEPTPVQPQQTAPQQTANVQQAQPQQQAMPQGVPMQAGMPQGQQPLYGMPVPDVNVQPVQFQQFNPSIVPLNQQENIDLIMDVPLEVTVELGRTNKSIKEILDFSPGTIIELNKLAGEPIDVLVNGKFVAKGEVVVIEENFGVKVTEIIK
jgi:flagellar motor switch protein FliN/FliY